MKQTLLKSALLVIITSLAGWGLSPAPTQALSVAQATGTNFGSGCTKDKIKADDIIAQTNVERAKAGIGPLTRSRLLTKAAKLKAQDMVTTHYWGHISPTGVTPWFWLETVGYNFKYAAENLAEDGKSTESVFVSWLDSPHHKANMLNPLYTQVGIAIKCGVTDHYTTLVVAEYGTPR